MHLVSNDYHDSFFIAFLLALSMATGLFSNLEIIQIK